MKTILEELIRLNVSLEGTLRVALQRESPEALESARQTLERIDTLFASLGVRPSETEATAVKEAEAIAPEQQPVEPPAPSVAPVIPATAAGEKPAEPMTVDEMHLRRECRDLRKAFTLNDKFLFRRELFGGSEQEFYDTIDLLTAMSSLDEAREYLFDDLQWDPENEVVKDFMDIVTNHFKSNPA